MSNTYKIVRMYADESKGKRTIKRGLTIEEAQAHCNDPSTKKVVDGKTIWFDGWTDDK